MAELKVSRSRMQPLRVFAIALGFLCFASIGPKAKAVQVKMFAGPAMFLSHRQVPDVVNLTRAAADQRIKDAGLTPAPVLPATIDPSRQRVTSQEPKAGVEVRAGARVYMTSEVIPFPPNDPPRGWMHLPLELVIGVGAAFALAVVAAVLLHALKPPPSLPAPRVMVRMAPPTARLLGPIEARKSSVSIRWSVTLASPRLDVAEGRLKGGLR